jgi:GAF domain-containing protein
MSNLLQSQQLLEPISHHLQQGTALNVILQDTISRLQQTLQVDYAHLSLRNGNQQNIRFVSQRASQEQIVGNVCPYSSFYNEALQAQQTVVCRTPQEVEHQGLKQLLDYQGVKAFLAVPIYYQGFNLGTICIDQYGENRDWTTAEVELLEKVASQCAIAIYQHQLQGKVQQQQRKEQLLNEIVQILGSDLDPDEILQKILWRIGETFEVDRVVVFRLQNDTVSVHQEWRIDEQIPSLKGRQMPITEWLMSLDPNCERSGHFLTSHSGVLDLGEQSLAPLQTPSTLNVPILVCNKLYGGLTVQILTEERNFASDEVQTIEKTADYTAIALSRLHREQRLNQLEREKQDSLIAYRTKNELLSSLGDEVRIPLTGIIGFTRLLRAQIHGALNEKQLEYSEVIESSAYDLSDLINDVVAISRIETSREELVLETILVKEVCLEALALIPESEEKKNVQLGLEIKDEMMFCIADKKRLKQILVNLLSLAIGSAQRGVVTLKVERENEEILFHTIYPGTGLMPEESEQSWKPGQKVNLVRHQYGMGIGFALSRKLAKLHRGDITMEVEQGKESCLTLHLPAMDVVG